MNCTVRKIQLTWGRRCVHTAAAESSGTGERSGAGEGREKKTELASLQSYFLCTILVCFRQERKNWKYWKEERAQNIWHKRKKYKQNKETLNLRATVQGCISEQRCDCVCPLPSHTHKQIKKSRKMLVAKRFYGQKKSGEERRGEERRGEERRGEERMHNKSLTFWHCSSCGAACQCFFFWVLTFSVSPKRRDQSPTSSLIRAAYHTLSSSYKHALPPLSFTHFLTAQERNETQIEIQRGGKVETEIRRESGVCAYVCACAECVWAVSRSIWGCHLRLRLLGVEPGFGNLPTHASHTNWTGK